MPILHKTLGKLEEEETPFNPFCEASIALISKLKMSQEKEILQNNILYCFLFYFLLSL